MNFKKGHSKKGGRKKGTPNRIARPIKELLSNYCQENWNHFQSKLGKLEGIDYVKSFLALLEYSVPKLARAEIITEENFLENRERLTVEERRFLIDQLRKETSDTHKGKQ